MKRLKKMSETNLRRYASEQLDGLLHALGAAGPVAVMEVQLLALEDERAHAVLFHILVAAPQKLAALQLTWLVEIFFNALAPILYD